jgi:glycosyltransferase involved in cell wall biosynthesis
MPQRVMPLSPTISVVAAAYNAQRYLAQMIDSFLAQKFGDFELVVVDDGSTDATAQILRRYQKQDARVKPLFIEHAGIVGAANAGLEAAQCELIARADADDISLPQRLEKQLAYMREHPECVALGSRMILIEPYGSPLCVTDHKLTHEEIDAGLMRGGGWVLPQPAVMLRREPVMRVGMYRNKFEWSEDLDLFLRLAEVGRVANLPDALVKYRIHPHSSNHTKRALQLALKRELVAEAYARRGLTMPANLEFKMRPMEDDAQRYTTWTWAALKDRNVAGARRHAIRALRHRPLSLASWRAAYCALRGR